MLTLDLDSGKRTWSSVLNIDLYNIDPPHQGVMHTGFSGCTDRRTDRQTDRQTDNMVVYIRSVAE